MVNISIEEDRLVVDVLGSHKVWALRSRIQVPLTRVRGARRATDAAKGWWKGVRVGTHLPGQIASGHFYRRSGWEFWDVRRGGQAIEIELDGARYRRLVVDVEDPDGALTLIGDATSPR